MIDIQAVLSGYLGCALWTATNDEGEPLDQKFDVDDFFEESRSNALSVCQSFCSQNQADLSGIDPVQIGHDLWLTRNGHGSGFWDRGLEDQQGERLTQAAHGLGEASVVVVGNQLHLDR